MRRSSARKGGVIGWIRPDGELGYNGVVYNEMKGAFSSPESVLDRVVFKYPFFPDTPYANESGGDPEHIPELTYEQFLAFPPDLLPSR